jgi:hypothetical protein
VKGVGSENRLFGALKWQRAQYSSQGPVKGVGPENRLFGALKWQRAKFEIEFEKFFTLARSGLEFYGLPMFFSKNMPLLSPSGAGLEVDKGCVISPVGDGHNSPRFSS